MKNSSRILTGLLTGALVISGLFSNAAFAQSPTPTSVNPGQLPDFGLGAAAERAFGRKLTDVAPEVIVGQVILSLLGFVGLIFLVLTIYAGFLWMTAGGNEDKVKKSKQIIVSAVIGMIIIFSSYALTSFFLNQVVSSTTPTTPTVSPSS